MTSSSVTSRNPLTAAHCAIAARIRLRATAGHALGTAAAPWRRTTGRGERGGGGGSGGPRGPSVGGGWGGGAPGPRPNGIRDRDASTGLTPGALAAGRRAVVADAAARAQGGGG